VIHGSWGLWSVNLDLWGLSLGLDLGEGGRWSALSTRPSAPPLAGTWLDVVCLEVSDEDSRVLHSDGLENDEGKEEEEVKDVALITVHYGRHKCEQADEVNDNRVDKVGNYEGRSPSPHSAHSDGSENGINDQPEEESRAE